MWKSLQTLTGGGFPVFRCSGNIEELLELDWVYLANWNCWLREVYEYFLKILYLFLCHSFNFCIFL